MLFRVFVFTAIYMVFYNFGCFLIPFWCFLGPLSGRFWPPFWVSDFQGFSQSEELPEYFNEAVFNYHFLLFFDVF